MTPEQNKTYILNNLDKYIIDGKGNFINFDKDYSSNDYCIWSENVKDYQKVKEKTLLPVFRLTVSKPRLTFTSLPFSISF